MSARGLIIVDIQNDFLPQGSLGIATAEEILPLVNRMLNLPFETRIGTQDWHPSGHCSFASTWAKKVGERIVIDDIEQNMWPDHCIQGTRGAEFSNALDVACFDHVVHKGIDPKVDSYSTFFDNQRLRSTGLESYLRQKESNELYFAGLATEYCVFYSVMDAIALGFQPFVVLDACRGIDLHPGDVERALRTMIENGAKLITTEEVEHRLK